VRTYTITLNETQAGTIQIACEVLARLGIGQFRDALEHLPTVEFMPPGWHEDMDQIGQILSKHMQRTDQTPHQISTREQHKVAWDLYTLVRHRLSWDRAIDEGRTARPRIRSAHGNSTKWLGTCTPWFATA